MSISQNYPIVSPSLSLDFANTKTLDPRITFSRPTGATYYDGKTVSKAEENLLLRSQEFNLWTNYNTPSTLANTTIAPDGTLTADTIVDNNALDAHARYQNVVLAGGTYSLSVFAKKGTAQGVFLRVRDTLGGGTIHLNALVDLTTGLTVLSPTGTVNVTLLNDGYFRVTVSGAVTAGTRAVMVGTVDNDISFYSGTGKTTIVWGAQLEARDTVTAYTPTTTQPITNYIPTLLTAPANVARFDHDPVTGESLGLEVEEQRTNLFTYSEEFDNAYWTKQRASITANTILAPDGTLTGDNLVEDTTVSNTHIVFAANSYISGTAYTHCIYAKANNRGLQIYTRSQIFGSNGAHNFNLITGVATVAAAGAVTSYGMTPVGNGWYRCWVTATATVTINTHIEFRILNTDSTTAVYTGDGYSGIYIWGAQLEAGAFPTSYIKTVASQVTRAADSASMTGSNFSSWYNQSQGTLYTDAVANGFTGANMIAAITDGTTNNVIQHFYASGNILRAGVITSGTTVSDLSLGSVSANIVYKMALAYQVNNYALSVNSGAVTTDTNGVLPIVNTIGIGNRNAIFQLNGTIKKIAYYPVRISNTQLQALTS